MYKPAHRMDDLLFYVLFNSVSVNSGWCTMELCIGKDFCIPQESNLGLLIQQASAEPTQLPGLLLCVCLINRLV